MAVYRRYQRKLKLKRKERPRKTQLQDLWEWRMAEGEHEKQRWAMEFQLAALEKLYEGHQMPSWWKSPESWFSINLLFAAFKILKRTVVPRKLNVAVRPRRTFKADADLVMQLQAQSELREAVLQYWTESLGLPKEASMAYLSAMWAFGCIKVGYTAEMEDNANAGRPETDSRGNFIYDEGQMMLEGDKSVVKEDFFLDWVDYECVLVDKNCSNDVDKTGKWVAHKFFRSVQELKDDPLYKGTEDIGPSALEDVEKSYLKQDEFKMPYLRFGDPGPPLDEDQVVVLYEIYDLHRGEVVTIARGHTKPLRGPEKLPPGIDGHPFEFLKFSERRGSFYPIPGFYNWMGPQLEYNVRRNMMALHLKRYSRKYMYFNIEPEEISKLEESEDGTYARAEGADSKLEPIKDAPLDQAHYFDTSKLRMEFDEMSGVGTLQRNVPQADSATEAEIVERRAREGELDDHEIVMDFICRVTNKLHKCAEANLTQDGAVEVTGPAGQSWVFFGPEDFEKIQGEFLFEVRADEERRHTLMVERAQLLQLLDLLAKNPLLALSDTLLRAVMDKFPAISGNEALVQELKQLAIFAMQLQGIQGGAQPGGGQKPGATRPREVSEQSRKVAAK